MRELVNVITVKKRLSPQIERDLTKEYDHVTIKQNIEIELTGDTEQYTGRCEYMCYMNT